MTDDTRFYYECPVHGTCYGTGSCPACANDTRRDRSSERERGDVDKQKAAVIALGVAAVALLFTNPAALGDALAAVGQGLSATAAALSEAAQSATGGR